MDTVNRPWRCLIYFEYKIPRNPALLCQHAVDRRGDLHKLIVSHPGSAGGIADACGQNIAVGLAPRYKTTCTSL